MPLPPIAGEFRLAADPELRFTPAGKAVAEVRLVASKRKKDGDEWVDDKTLWINAVAWDKTAENIAESLEKGMLVIAHGVPYTENWEDKDGNKRSTVKMQLYGIGPSLSWATAKVSKVERGSGGGDQYGSSRPAERSSGLPADDPWATGPAQTDEPPF